MQVLHAETVYKGTDANGNIVFSDHPFPNSKAIDVAPVQTYSTPPVSTSLEPAPTAQALPLSYKINIVQPSNAQFFTHEIQSIDVNLSMEPQLQSTDSIVVMLNDKPYGTYDSTSGIKLINLPRGAYQLHVNVVSKSDTKKIISQSSNVTFYQQRITSIKAN